MRAFYASDCVLEIHCSWAEFDHLIRSGPDWIRSIADRAATVDHVVAIALREHIRRGGTPRIIPSAHPVST